MPNNTRSLVAIDGTSGYLNDMMIGKPKYPDEPEGRLPSGKVRLLKADLLKKGGALSLANLTVPDAPAISQPNDPIVIPSNVGAQEF